MSGPTLTRSLPRRGAPLGQARVRRAELAQLIAGSVIALPIVMLAVAAHGIAGCTHEDPPKIAETKRQLQKYVDGYAEWRVMNRDTPCPQRLEDLHPAMGSGGGTARDGYMNPLRFLCTETGIVVWSHGEDEKPHTADDLWSDAR